MWLVSQPNSVILEVKVEPNSIGQECLERVSQFNYKQISNISRYIYTTRHNIWVFVYIGIPISFRYGLKECIKKNYEIKYNTTNRTMFS